MISSGKLTRAKLLFYGQMELNVIRNMTPYLKNCRGLVSVPILAAGKPQIRLERENLKISMTIMILAVYINKVLLDFWQYHTIIIFTINVIVILLNYRFTKYLNALIY